MHDSLTTIDTSWWKRITLSDTTKRRGFAATIAASWISLLLVCVLLAMLMGRSAHKVDVERVVNSYMRAAFFGTNFLLVTLGAGPNDASKLADMSITGLPLAEQNKPVINTHPFVVYSVNIMPDITRTKASAAVVEWGMTAAATLIIPGQNTSTRNYFRLLLLEIDKDFKALDWPRPVNETSHAVEVKPYYTNGVGLTTPLGGQIKDFMTAYYATGPVLAPGTTRRLNPLDGLVTASFGDTPISNSPFSRITVLSIMQSHADRDTATAKPGDTVHVQVTAKAAASNDTYVPVSAPLRVKLADNNQWLIDGFDEPIHFGEVSFK